MIKSHLAQVVFWSAIVLSVASMASLSILEEPYLWIGVVLVAVSIAFNLWSVYRSDNSGFVQSREFRRAYEPARRFNMVQVFVVFAFIMVQCGLGAYALIS